jgi:hypothetical protein
MMVRSKAKEKVETDVNVQRPYSCNSWLVVYAANTGMFLFFCLTLFYRLACVRMRFFFFERERHLYSGATD